MALNVALHGCQADTRTLEFIGLVLSLERGQQLVGIGHVEPDAIIANAVRHIMIGVRRSRAGSEI